MWGDQSEVQYAKQTGNEGPILDGGDFARILSSHAKVHL